MTTSSVALALVLLSAGSGCSKTAALAAPAPFATPVPLREGDAPGLVVDRIKLLGTVELSPTPADGVQMHELSGLAWDEERGHLWAVSDRGDLYALLPLFDGDALVGASFVGTWRLQQGGKPVKSDAKDAEGLVLITHQGRRGLAVSYEKEPRVIFHDFDGKDLARLSARSLEDPLRYEEDNHALEALAVHPTYQLIVAPEQSPNNKTPGHIPLWQATRDEPLGVFVGLGTEHAAVVAMEDVGDGRLLVLERRFLRKGRRLTTALSLVTPTPGTERLVVERLAKLKTEDGWRHDNYEGLTRHRDHRFFMVTDDNGGPPQRTLLTYFEIPGLDRSAPSSATAPARSPSPDPAPPSAQEPP